MRPQGYHTWYHVWAGNNKSTENLVVNMKYWSKEKSAYLYKKQLQEKHTTKDHWLMWSTERMNPEKLHVKVSQQIKLLSPKKYTFCFHFRMLHKHISYNHSNASKWNKTMIVEVKRDKKTEIYCILGRIFSSSWNKKLLGTYLRMIPFMNNDLPTHNKMDITHLINKQEQFFHRLSQNRAHPSVKLTIITRM